ncbi:MAG: hypothetical protein Q9195_001847 [Heterodermia aff. obscurata]
MAIVETSMHFLARDKLYEHEKPYQLKYEPEKGISNSNLRLEKQEPLKISSIRGREQQFSMEENGFAVLKLDKEIPYDDFSDPAGIRRYLDVVSENLKTLLGADKIRKRDPGFPIMKKGNRYDYNQPSTVAHIDSTPEEAVSTFRQVNGDLKNFSPNLRYQVVNVQADDLMPTDVVFAAKATENLQVHYDAAHQWYYLEDQEPSELLVFRQADSHPVGRVERDEIRNAEHKMLASTLYTFFVSST